jgi:hypothetical protein
MNEPTFISDESPAPSKPSISGIVQRFIGIFTAPQTTLSDIAQHPNWIVPLVFIVLATALLTQWIVPAVIQDAKPEIEKRLAQRDVPAEQAEQITEISLRNIRNFSAVSAGVGILIVSLITAAALLFIGNIVLGGKSNFQQIFSVYMWTGLVSILGFLLKIPLVLKQMTTKIHFSPAAFFPAEAETGTLFRIAAIFDIFTIWRIVLIAIGFSLIYKLSPGKSLAVLGGFYLAFALIRIFLVGTFGG